MSLSTPILTCAATGLAVAASNATSIIRFLRLIVSRSLHCFDRRLRMIGPAVSDLLRARAACFDRGTPRRLPLTFNTFSGRPGKDNGPASPHLVAGASRARCTAIYLSSGHPEREKQETRYGFARAWSATRAVRPARTIDFVT